MNLQSKQGSHTPAHMHVTARVAGREEVDVEVGEACRTIQALKEAVVVALPQLRVEGFDVSVGGRALDDEGVVSLEHGACLDVVPDTRGLAVEALREAGRGVSEAGLFAAARRGDDGLCTLYLDAGCRLTAGMVMAGHLFTTRAATSICRSPSCCSTEAAVR